LQLKIATLIALVVPLNACSFSFETESRAEFYFAETDPVSAAPECAKATERNWFVETFASENLEHTYVGPIGLICARDGNGKLVKAYRHQSNRTSTHRLVRATNFWVIPWRRFEQRDQKGEWSEIGANSAGG
jgi:hypothetical protein